MDAAALRQSTAICCAGAPLLPAKRVEHHALQGKNGCGSFTNTKRGRIHRVTPRQRDVVCREIQQAKLVTKVFKQRLCAHIKNLW